MTSIITIDICIPIFLYGGNNTRKELTEKIFRHLINIKNKFQDKALFSFTIIGSENELSKSLFTEYFNGINDTYHEFNQDIVAVNMWNGTSDINKMVHMLSNKFKCAYKNSFNKNKNISLLMGSNDYISYNWFEQIIDFYNGDTPQLFGITSYNEGENLSVLLNYINNNNSNNTVITSGIYHRRDKYKYIGGIIGFNDKLYLQHRDTLLNNIITCDEGELEYKTLQLPDVILFKSNKCIFLNPKTNTTDISPFVNLLYTANIVNPNDELKKQIEEELSNFYSL